MKLQKKNRPLARNPLVWVVLIVVLTLGAFTLEKTGLTNFVSHPDTQGPTAEQKRQDAESSAAKKKATIEQPDTKADPYSTPVAPANQKIELSAKQEANNSVTVFTKLYGYSDGTCKLTVSNGTKTTSQTADAMYQPEYASCAGFSVPVDSVGKGNWSIQLSITSGGKTTDETMSFEVK